MNLSLNNGIYKLGLIAIIISVVYVNTLNHDFVWDDTDIIVDNPLIEKISNIPKIFTSEDSSGASTGYYRPITYVSFVMDSAIWGMNPVGFNVTNVLLHIMVTILFYLVTVELFRKENLAFVAALVFSLHPVAGETVNFHAGGRNTLLSAGFALLSLLLYSKKKNFFAVASFTIAIFSKEFALLMPLAYIAYDHFLAKNKTRWAHYLPFAIAATCYFILRSHAVERGSNLLSIMNNDSIKIFPQIVGKYFFNMVWPFDLKVLYEANIFFSWLPFILYSTLIIAIIAAAFLYCKNAVTLCSIGAFLVFMLPVSNIFPLGSTIVADRYAYFMLFGFSLGLAYCICLAKKRIIVIITVSLCVVFATIDIQRNSIWKDNYSFFTRMQKDAPERYIGYQGLAQHYFENLDFANTARYLTLSLSKNEVNPAVLVGSATMLWVMRRPDEALALLDLSLRYDPANPHAYILKSRIYGQSGDAAKAKYFIEKAEEVDPGILNFLDRSLRKTFNKGEELLSRNKLFEAELCFRKTLRFDPVFTPALIQMGVLRNRQGNYNGSVKYYSRAIDVEPGNVMAHYNLFKMYERTGNMAAAQGEISIMKRLDQNYGSPFGYQLD